METYAFILNNQNILNHFICGNNWKESRQLVCLKTAVNVQVVEKYFMDDSDIDTICEAIIEEPEYVSFDHVFKSNQIFQFYNHVLKSKISQGFTTKESQLFLIYSNKFQSLLWEDDSNDDFAPVINFCGELLLFLSKFTRLQIQCRIYYLGKMFDLSCDPSISYDFKSKEELLNVLKTLNGKIYTFLQQNEVDSFDSKISMELTLFHSQMYQIAFLVLPNIGCSDNSSFAKTWVEVKKNLKLVNREHESFAEEIEKNVEKPSNLKNQGKINSSENKKKSEISFKKQKHSQENFDTIFLKAKSIFSLIFVEQNTQDFETLIKFMKELESLKSGCFFKNRNNSKEKFKRFETFCDDGFSPFVPKKKKKSHFCENKNFLKTTETKIAIRENSEQDDTSKHSINKEEDSENLNSDKNNLAPSKLPEMSQNSFEFIKNRSIKKMSNEFKKRNSRTKLENWPSAKNNSAGFFKREKNEYENSIFTEKNPLLPESKEKKLSRLAGSFRAQLTQKLKNDNKLEQEISKMNPNLLLNDEAENNHHLGSREIEFSLSNVQNMASIKFLHEKIRRNQDLYEHKISELQKENMFLKNSFQLQTKNFKSLELEMIQKVSELEEEKLQNHTLELRVTEIQSAYKILKNDFLTLEKQNADLTERLCCATAKLSKKEKNDRKTEKKSQSKEKENLTHFNKLNFEKTTLEKQLEDLKNKERDNFSVFESLKNENSHLKELFNSKEKLEIQSNFERQRLAQCLQDLKDSIHQKDALIVKAESEHQQTQTKITSLEEEIKRNAKKIKTTMKKNEESVKAISLGFESKIAETQKTNEIQKDKIVALEFQLKNANKTDEHFQNKIIKYKRLKENHSYLEKNFREMEKILLDKNRLIEEKNQVLCTFEFDLKRQQQLTETLVCENQVFKELRITLEKEANELSFKLSDQINLADALKHELEKNKEQRLFYESQKFMEINKFDMKLKEIATELAALQMENEKLNIREEAYQKEISSLTLNLDATKKKKDQKKSEIFTLLQKNSVLKEELQSRETEFHKCKVEVESMSKTQDLNYKKVGLIGDIKGLISCYKNLNK